MSLKDKIKHFFLSFLLAILIYLIFKNRYLTIFLVLSVGLIKEVHDQKKRKNTFKESGLDILADVLGISLGIILIDLLKIM